MADIRSAQRRSTRGTHVVVATSAEPSAVLITGADRRWAFGHRVSALELPEDEQWSVALGSISFFNVASQNVFVSASIVQPSRVGSQVVNQLFHIPVTGAAGTFSLEVSNLLFRPVSTSSLTYIEIELTDQQGNTLPAPPAPSTDPETYVTLMFRRGDVV